jgi:hypothetical protein
MFTLPLPPNNGLPERAVSETLQTNNAEVVQQVTGGCCTVAVQSVRMEGPHDGHAIVWIGGVARLEERLTFEIDWGNRTVKFTAPEPG